MNSNEQSTVLPSPDAFPAQPPSIPDTRIRYLRQWLANVVSYKGLSTDSNRAFSALREDLDADLASAQAAVAALEDVSSNITADSPAAERLNREKDVLATILEMQAQLTAHVQAIRLDDEKIYGSGGNGAVGATTNSPAAVH